MNILVTPSALKGAISVPGSKSHTIRAVLFAMLAEGVSRIHAPLVSEDTLAALRAAETFGAKIVCGNDSLWEITGTAGKLHIPEKTVDFADSGTGIKLFAAAASVQSGKITYDGDASLRTRPMRALLDALAQGGVQTESRDGKCPFTLTGPFRGGHTVTVNGKSSQYVSAMLIAGALAQGGETELHVTDVNEKPYIGLTLAWFRKLGLRCTASQDYDFFTIPGGQTLSAFECVIPADFSTAAFPLIAAALTKSELDILNLDFQDVQGDKVIFSRLDEMGAHHETDGNRTRIFPQTLRGADFDLNASPDTLPAMAAAAAFAEGSTRLYNVAQARIKETDRIACMTKELRKMGIAVDELPDGMVIHGGKPHGAVLESYGDHRIAMALTCAALAAEGPSTILNAECAAVTYPDFFRDFAALGAAFTVQ